MILFFLDGLEHPDYSSLGLHAHTTDTSDFKRLLQPLFEIHFRSSHARFVFRPLPGSPGAQH